MSVSSRFDKATKRIAVAGALAVTALFPNLAAALEVGQCVTGAALHAEGQIPVIEAGGIAVEDPRKISLVMYSSSVDGSQGYELIGKKASGAIKPTCYEVRSVLTNVRLNNNQANKEVRSDFYSQTDNAFNAKLRANIQAGNLPILQAENVSAGGQMITVYTNSNPDSKFVAEVKRIDPSIEVTSQAGVAVFIADAAKNKLQFAMVNPIMNSRAPQSLYAFQPTLAAN